MIVFNRELPEEGQRHREMSDFLCFDVRDVFSRKRFEEFYETEAASELISALFSSPNV
jgi:hypothetical protein